jgi:hypothetical protein
MSKVAQSADFGMFERRGRNGLKEFNSECPRKRDTSLSSKSQIWTKFFSQPPVTLKTPPPKKIKKFAQQIFARARPQIS